MSGSLLCCTTEIAAEKSIGEVVAMLAQKKASSILQEFDGAGNVTALSFKITTRFGEMAFRLPSDVPATMQVLKNQYAAKRIARKYADDSKHARRVAWRILRSWVEAQLALVEIGGVQIEQVFLPYAQTPDGKTMYEGLVERRFSGLALPAPSESAEGTRGSK